MNPRDRVLPLALLAALAVGVASLATGCRKPPSGAKDDSKAAAGPKGDPEEGN